MIRRMTNGPADRSVSGENAVIFLPIAVSWLAAVVAAWPVARAWRMVRQMPGGSRLP